MGIKAFFKKAFGDMMTIAIVLHILTIYIMTSGNPFDNTFFQPHYLTVTKQYGKILTVGGSILFAFFK